MGGRGKTRLRLKSALPGSEGRQGYCLRSGGAGRMVLWLVVLL